MKTDRKKERRGSGLFSTLILIVALCVFLYSGYRLFTILSAYAAANSEYNGLQDDFTTPYSGPEDFDTSCATDPARFAWYDAIKASRTEFQNNVPSYQWSLEALKVTKQILSPGAPEKISCPVILFSADKDFSVLPGPQKEFIKRVPNGHYEFVSGSRHEIFRSVNSVLFPWWHRIISFYSDNISLLKR